MMGGGCASYGWLLHIAIKQLLRRDDRSHMGLFSSRPGVRLWLGKRRGGTLCGRVVGMICIDRVVRVYRERGTREQCWDVWSGQLGVGGQRRRRSESPGR